jgi:hypothetical protein
MFSSGFEVILSYKVPGHDIDIQIFLMVKWEGLKKLMTTN